MYRKYQYSFQWDKEDSRTWFECFALWEIKNEYHISSNFEISSNLSHHEGFELWSMENFEIDFSLFWSSAKIMNLSASRTFHEFFESLFQFFGLWYSSKLTDYAYKWLSSSNLSSSIRLFPVISHSGNTRNQINWVN